MAATVTTNNPNGLGYQTGLFSAPNNLDGTFFKTMFEDRFDKNNLFRTIYNCNVVQECNMATWLETFSDTQTSCEDHWSTLEYNGSRQQIRANAQATIPAYPATGTITLSSKDHFVSGQYVLPRIGNTIVLAPSGELAKITNIVHATANDTVITVQKRSGTANSSTTVPSGAEMLILAGSELSGCDCPTGEFAYDDMPIEHAFEMIHFGDKGELCGDDLEACHRIVIPFLDDNGNEVGQAWWTEPQQKMLRRMEDRKYYETMLNPIFGIIPNVKAQGIKFTPASATEIVLDDIREWKKQLDAAGIAGREYAVFAGNEIYSQFQTFLATLSVAQRITFTDQPMAGCKWIDMDYCGINVEGLRLHIYDDCTFSSGKGLGASGMNFPSSAIFYPMGNMQSDVKRSLKSGWNGYSNKLWSRVYFRSQQGRVYNMYTDSNGLLGPRNTFGAGCKQHEWTAETRFANELHCLAGWGYMGLA